MERRPEALPEPMAPPNDLTRAIRHLLARHQRQVIRRSLLASALLLGCLALGWWRLSAAGVATAWKAGLLVAGLAGLALWQGFLLRRDWLSVGQWTMQLDRALGLHARLVTAAEFADVAEPPALYGVLVEETQQALTDVSSRLPRATGRSTWLLAAVLLLLWLWPPRGAPLTQLAMRPPEMPPQVPPIPPPEPPNDQPQQQQQNQQNQSASGQGASGSQGQQPSSSPSQGASGQQPSKESNATGSGRAGDAGEPTPQQGAESSAAQQPQASRGAPRQEQSSSGNQRSASAQRRDQARGSSSSGGAQRADQRGAQGGQQQAGAAGSKDAKAEAGASGTKAGTSPGEAAEQAALRGDIQQLLKELSGELQTLQAQGLTKPSEQAQSLPGTATDPKLYDDTAEPLASTTGGRPLSIALDVDTQSTSTTRRGGGTATPSGDISDAPPQQAEEAVALADAPTESAAGSRQAIPPEYQPVFERLSQRHNTSSKP